MAGQTLPDFVLKALQKIATDNGFESHEIHQEEGSKAGDGFTSDVIRVTISGQRTPSDEKTSLILVVKVPPTNEDRRKLALIVFEREVLAYNNVLPAFDKFQLECGLAPSDIFNSYPKCYFAHFDKETGETAIILEDLRERQFTLGNKFDFVDLERTRKVCEALGRLHAVSLAMRVKQPETFATFQQLSDIFSEAVPKDLVQASVSASTPRVLNVLDQPGDEVYREKLIEYEKNCLAILNDCTKVENFEPFGAVAHGDCWINNVMFRYEVSDSFCTNNSETQS